MGSTGMNIKVQGVYCRTESEIGNERTANFHNSTHICGQANVHANQVTLKRQEEMNFSRSLRRMLCVMNQSAFLSICKNDI